MGGRGIRPGPGTAADAAWRAVLQDLRHAHLNHLQVAAGWLQMGRADEAARYLDRVARWLAVEAVLARLEPPALARALLRAAAAAQAAGVSLAVTAGDLGAAAAGRAGARRLQALARVLSAAVAACPPGSELAVALSAGGGDLAVHLGAPDPAAVQAALAPLLPVRGLQVQVAPGAP